MLAYELFDNVFLRDVSLDISIMNVNTYLSFNLYYSLLVMC